MNIGKRLKHARTALGLTQEQVRQKTSFGGSSISEWESETREPSFSQLSILAKLYGRATSFFLEEGEIESAVVLWRRKPEEVLASEMEVKLVELAEQFHRLEQLCGNSSFAQLPSVNCDLDTFTEADGEKLARKVRLEFSLGERPGSSLLRILEEISRIKIFHLSFEPSGTAACTLNERYGAAILLNSNNSRYRRNFELAHELFHLLTWDFFRKDEQLSVSSEEEEGIADIFASCLLMPTEPLKIAMDGQRNGKSIMDFDDLFEIARQFDVSLIAVIRRMARLRFIDRDSAEEICKTIQPKVESWEKQMTETPPERPVRFQSLAKEAIGKGLISTGKFADYMGISRSAAMKLIENEINDIGEERENAQVTIIDS